MNGLEVRAKPLTGTTMTHVGALYAGWGKERTDAWIEKVATVGYQPIWYKEYSADTVFAYLEREGDPLLIEFLQMPSSAYPADGTSNQ